jgi:hypothetical protein
VAHPKEPWLPSNSACMRIESTQQLLRIVFSTATLAYYFRAEDFEALQIHQASPLRFADVNARERTEQPKDIQEPQHHGYNDHSVQD